MYRNLVAMKEWAAAVVGADGVEIEIDTSLRLLTRVCLALFFVINHLLSKNGRRHCHQSFFIISIHPPIHPAPPVFLVRRIKIPTTDCYFFTTGILAI